MTLKKALIAVFVAFSVALNATPTADGLYAIFKTSAGEFTAELFYEQAPLSSANMVGLAEGTLPHYNSSNTPIYSKFYDGLTFHRIIDGFVIQGGDPLGDGTGGPGYDWPDEVSLELIHEGEGILSMANSGANSNGSQFFITLGTQSHLNGLHNVFGKVVEGIETVRALGKTPANDNGVPNSAPIIQTIEILRIGEAANAFDPTFYANNFDPNIPLAGVAVDSDTSVTLNESGKIAVSTPFKPLTRYRVSTSNNLETWNEEQHIQPSLDASTTPPEFLIDPQAGSSPKFVKIDTTKYKAIDVSGIIDQIEFESGTETNPYTEIVKFTSSDKATYSVNDSTPVNVDVTWFEINDKRNQLFVEFSNGTFIQFYQTRSNGNQGDLFLRDKHYKYDPNYRQWILIDSFATGTFEIIPIP